MRGFGLSLLYRCMRAVGLLVEDCPIVCVGRSTMLTASHLNCFGDLSLGSRRHCISAFDIDSSSAALTRPFSQ